MLPKPTLFISFVMMSLVLTGCVVETNEEYLPPLSETTEQGWTRIDTQALDEYMYQTPGGSLSLAAMDGLVFLRHGERLSRDLALAFMDIYGSHPFFGQAGAEQSHGDAVSMLMGRYALHDAVAEQTEGVYEDPYWQDEYDFFIALGELSYIDALLVSLEIQEASLADIRYWYEHGEEDFVVMETYAALLKATRNHLRVLAQELASVGFEYDPVYLTPLQYENIIHTPLEY